MGKYPWLVALWRREIGRQPSEYYELRGCGGSIIASRFVLSAAHCLFLTRKANNREIVYKELTKDELAIRVGLHCLNQECVTGEEMFKNVRRINKHYEYRQQLNQPRWRHGFDIVIFELEDRLDLNKFTPVCLPRHSEGISFDGKTITLVGWGSDGTDLSVPTNEPYEVDVTVATTDACLLSNQNPNIMCAGQTEDRKGACKVSLNYNFTLLLLYLSPSP